MNVELGLADQSGGDVVGFTISLSWDRFRFVTIATPAFLDTGAADRFWAAANPHPLPLIAIGRR